jgi:hypothetical protein
VQKLLGGSGITPDEFTCRGWAVENRKVLHMVDPRTFARDWQRRPGRRLSRDLDQAFVLIGACYDGSGINAVDTLRDANFRPHPALPSLLEWLVNRGPTQVYRDAASRALSIYNGWAKNQTAGRKISGRRKRANAGCSQ